MTEYQTKKHSDNTFRQHFLDNETTLEFLTRTSQDLKTQKSFENYKLLKLN